MTMMDALSLGAVLPETVAPYAALMGVGFLIAIFGHMSGSKWTVAIGIIVIMLATLLFPLALEILTENEPARPGPETPGI